MVCSGGVKITLCVCSGGVETTLCVSSGGTYSMFKYHSYLFFFLSVFVFISSINYKTQQKRRDSPEGGNDEAQQGTVTKLVNALASS